MLFSYQGTMKGLIVLRPGLQPDSVTSLERPRTPMKCSVSSHDSMPCLYAHISEVPSENIRPSLCREWKMILNHYMKSSR